MSAARGNRPPSASPENHQLPGPDLAHLRPPSSATGRVVWDSQARAQGNKMVAEVQSQTRTRKSGVTELAEWLLKHNYAITWNIPPQHLEAVRLIKFLYTHCPNRETSESCKFFSQCTPKARQSSR